MTIKFDFLDNAGKSVRNFFQDAYKVDPKNRNDDTLADKATALFATVSFPEGNRAKVKSMSVTAPWRDEPLKVTGEELGLSA